MTVKDEILVRLLAGEDYSTIYRSVRGKKPFYEAYNEWLVIKEKQYAEMLRKQNALDSKIKTLQVEESALRNNVKGLQGQAQELERIEKQIVDSRNLLDATQKEFSEVQNQLYLLEEKGFNAEVLTETLRIDVDGTAFLKRLETGNAFKDLLLELQQEHENLKKVLQDTENAEKNLTLLRAQQKTISGQIRSESNVLDELKLKTRRERAGVRVVRGFFSQGYTVDDLQSLRKGIDLLGIRGNPEKSLSRVFEAIEKEGLLSGLTDRITDSRQELKTLKENVVEMRGELKALFSLAIEKTKGIPKVVQVAIEDVKANALNELTEVAAKSINELEAVGGKAQLELGDTQKLINALSTEFKKEIEKALKTVDVEVRKTVKKSDVDARKNMNNAVNQLNSVAGKIYQIFEDKKGEVDIWFEDKKGEVENYLAIREWMADNASKLKDMSSVVSLTEDPLMIMQMSPDFIMSLTRSFEIYVKEFFGNLLIEESIAVMRDRMSQTSILNRPTWKRKQTFTFLTVIKWCMNKLRRSLP